MPRALSRSSGSRRRSRSTGSASAGRATRSRRSSASAATATSRSPACRGCIARCRCRRSGRARATSWRSTSCARLGREPDGLEAVLRRARRSPPAPTPASTRSVARLRDEFADPRCARDRARGASSRRWRSRCRARCSCATRRRRSPTRSAPRGWRGDGGGLAYGTLPAGIDTRRDRRAPHPGRLMPGDAASRARRRARVARGPRRDGDQGRADAGGGRAAVLAWVRRRGRVRRGRAHGLRRRRYRAAGADIVSREAVYRDREVVIKLKGPTHGDLATIDPGALLICMAHVKSIPERAAICNERGIDLLALELVTERPPRGEAYVRSRLAMERILARRRPAGRRAAHRLRRLRRGRVRGAADTPPAATRAPSRCSPRRRTIALRTKTAERSSWTSPRLRRPPRRSPRTRSSRRWRGYRHAARSSPSTRRGAPARASGSTSPCATNERLATASDLGVTVLGYGNVAFGALDECMRSGVSHVHIRTERTTEHELLRPHLETRRPHHQRHRRARGPTQLRRHQRRPRHGHPPGHGHRRPRRRQRDQPRRRGADRRMHVAERSVLRGRRRLPLVGLGLAAGRLREGVDGALQRPDPRMLLFEERVLDGLEDAPEGIRRALVAGPLAR